MKTLFELRHLLVVAALEEYDRRIARGIHPYSMASYHFIDAIDEELAEDIDYEDWKADNWRELNKAIDCSLYNKLHDPFSSNEDVDFANGQWLVSAYLSSAEAWATPGFAEAYRWHSVWGG